MERDELIAALQEIERDLRSSEVQQFIRGQDLQTREQFVALRGQLTGLIEELRIAELEDIRDDLQRLADDLQNGIDALESSIERIDNAIEIVNTLSRVVNLVTRVVAFV